MPKHHSMIELHQKIKFYSLMRVARVVHLTFTEALQIICSQEDPISNNSKVQVSPDRVLLRLRGLHHPQ